MIDIALSLKYGGILFVTLYGGSIPPCGLKRRRRLKKVNNDERQLMAIAHMIRRAR